MGAAKKNQIQEMSLKAIRVDHDLQSRVRTDPEVAREYMEDLLRGAIFPAVLIFFDGSIYWLADGFHRFEAYKAAGRASIPADVRQGSRREAILAGITANVKNPLRLTRGDRRKSVLTLLKDKEYFEWSDYKIAEWTGMSHPTVKNIRFEYCTASKIPLPTIHKTQAYVDSLPKRLSLKQASNTSAWLKRKGVEILELGVPGPMTPDIWLLGAIVRIEPHFDQTSLSDVVGDLMLWSTIHPRTTRKIALCYPTDVHASLMSAAKKLGIQFMTPEELVAEFGPKGDRPAGEESPD